MRLFQALQAAVTIASYPAKTRWDSLVCRRHCQTFSTGFSSGDWGGSGSTVAAQWQQGEGLRDAQFFGRVPAGLVEHEDGMRLRGKAARDLVEVVRHGLRVGARHDHRRPGAARGADRAKQIGRFGAQVGERPRSGAASRPAPCARVFLAQAPRVLKPDFYRRFRGELCGDLSHSLGKVFLNSSIRAGSCPRWRGRAEMCRNPSRRNSLPMVRSR